MKTSGHPHSMERYRTVSEGKARGATYTPKILADFVARRLVEAAGELSTRRPLRILDPAVGHGELLVSLLERLEEMSSPAMEVHGFETDSDALAVADNRLSTLFPDAAIHFESGNFLEFALANFDRDNSRGLLCPDAPEGYDLIIANPPYVRTQIMGMRQARLLARQFCLAGRIDLYHAFILGISRVLGPSGKAGIIVSNRFMTTRSGESVREALLQNFNVLRAWDLGDTKLFGAAVLPAVLILEDKHGRKVAPPTFTSIYRTTGLPTCSAPNPIDALPMNGIVEIEDGRRFDVRHGKLDTSGTSKGTWRVATDSTERWLANVESRTWGTFRDIGRVRVGVKTCADRIFIRNDWQDMSVTDRPELLRPITTHHVARRFKAISPERPSHVLYPHETIDGRRLPASLANYPASKAYLEKNRQALESRRYVTAAGRKWYEVWVPQDPNSWERPKLVFRDIAETPTFWIDLSGSVVNGDCYWLTCHGTSRSRLLWLAAAVGNSTFIERYYDIRFNNKLYAGRRRFITQYVEQFPLPDPLSDHGKTLIAKARRIYECTPSPEADLLQEELNNLVWEALAGTGAVQVPLPQACSG